MVDLFIQYGADTNARDKHNRRAIHYASFNGHLQTVKALISGGADPSAKDKKARNSLFVMYSIFGLSFISIVCFLFAVFYGASLCCCKRSVVRVQIFSE